MLFCFCFFIVQYGKYSTISWALILIVNVLIDVKVSLVYYLADFVFQDMDFIRCAERLLKLSVSLSPGAVMTWPQIVVTWRFTNSYLTHEVHYILNVTQFSLHRSQTTLYGWAGSTSYSTPSSTQWLSFCTLLTEISTRTGGMPKTSALSGASGTSLYINGLWGVLAWRECSMMVDVL